MKFSDVPDEAKQIWKIGTDAEAAGQLEKAEEKYAEAIEIFPKFELAWSDLAFVQRDLGNVLKAIITAETALDNLPESSLLWANLGTFYLQAGLPAPRAEEALRKSIQYNPEQYGAMLNLGIMLAKLDKIEEAEHWLEQAKRLAPEDPVVWTSYVQVYADQKRCHEAAESLQRMKKLTTNPEQIRQIEEYMLQRCPDAQEPTAKEGRKDQMKSKEIEELLNEAEACVIAGRYGEAETIYRKALEINNKVAIVWGNLGVVLGIQERNDEAIKAFEKALKLDKKLGIILASFGAVLRKVGKYKKAEKVLKDATKYGPEIPTSWYNLANLLRETNRPKEAVDMYKKAIAINDANPNYWVGLGLALEMLQQWDEAERAFRRAVELDPNNNTAWREIGALLAQRGEHQSALEAIDRHLEIDPQDAACWFNRGVVTLSLNRTSESIEAYKRTTELDPTFVDAWFRLSAIYFVAGQLNSAEDAIRKAIELAPNDERHQHLLAKVLEKKNRVTKFYEVDGVLYEVDD